MELARLTRYGLLSVSGTDAREFLHAQLTKDIRNLAPAQAALAGWCSAKGRLLATFLVIPMQDGFFLQVARDIAPAVAKRLSMFVLRSKVKISDESDAWFQYGTWGQAPAALAESKLFSVSADSERVEVDVGEGRVLLLTKTSVEGATVPEERWTLAEIRAGRPLISLATQEMFVPQMVNLHGLGGVDFQKGCYPGQEVVARAQYRGQVKRHMVHAKMPADAAMLPGAAYQGGTVVDAARAEDGMELLAVLPVDAQ
jgi:tRNA-modifying protein YgfZ